VAASAFWLLAAVSTSNMETETKSRRRHLEWMNGTDPSRQFIAQATRLSSRATFVRVIERPH
jgi:hypothetical protein